LARPLDVKELEPISPLCPMASKDFEPLTQQIGPTSRCKAAFISYFFEDFRTHNIFVAQ